MHAGYFHRRTANTVVVLAIALAILFTQGVRLCTLAMGGMTSPDCGGQASIAYPTNILTAFDSDPCPPDQCASLSVILKNLQATLALLPFLTILLFLLPPRQLLRAARLPEPLFDTSRGYGLRPPLRAPPR